MDSPWSSFIFSWHMPLFFFISGFFLKFNRPFKDLTIDSLKRLMIPYFIFAHVGLLAEYIKRWALHRDALVLTDELIGIYWKMDMSGLIHQYGFVLWFLPALLSARVLLTLMTKIFAGNDLLILIGCFLCFYAGLNLSLPFCIDEGLTAVCWLFFGSFYFRRIQNVKYHSFLLIPSLCVLFLIPLPALDMASKGYDFIPYNFLWAFSVIVILVNIIKFVPESKFISSWGEQTMFLFIFHPYTNNVSHIFLQKIGFDNWVLKLVISLVILQVMMIAKIKLNNFGPLKYV